MNKKVATLTVALALSTTGNAQAVDVVGTRSCGAWVANSREAGFAQATDQTWLVGYLSGIAIGMSKDFLKDIDSPSIYLWVDSYCQAHPLLRIDNAGTALALELIKQKRL